ncbi:MAG: hypothetical protein A3Q59_04580 [Methanomethylophilus alvi]|nr:MAG: hypothetical protein A3Q59_04580 [Methanomethylophilus alvi]
MKALILANMGGVHYSGSDIVPSCFLKLYNDMTILDRQISLLNLNGFPGNNICVVCGTEGIWTKKEVKDKIQSLDVKIAYSPADNEFNGGALDWAFFEDDDVLIIEGNHIIDIAIISRLKRYHCRDVMVVDDVLDPDDAKQLIKIAGDDVVSIRNSDLIEFPWVTFAGIMKMSCESFRDLISASTHSRPLLEAINEILPKRTFKAVKYDDLIYGRINGGLSDELTGGSYSKLNYRLVVKKQCDNEGRAKLVNEIKWLLSIPPELKPYFSQILEYDIDSPNAFYNVPYYGKRNLREHIFDGHLDADAACRFLDGLLTWMFRNVYSRKIGDTPDGWVMEKHINRVLGRLPECERKSPEFARIIEADRVIINGKEYRNVRELYTRLSKMDDFLERVKPKAMVMIHGDLHFQNIILTNETDTGFILVDPRGESEGSDVYYDLGKVWHSFHAKYDFIHSDQFEYEMEWKDGVPHAKFRITNTFVEKVYDDIYAKFQKIIVNYDYIRNDPDWEMKILFAEASHLCSVSVFHIDKTEKPDRAIVMYLIGVQLINEFFDRYIKG